ncbi:lamin tail domain-containing protein [Actinocorallia sp. A-T 12471]|uniref:lamin tail domain-containing protein n=1 Tax=Actinocorallia sp. A-T 12471 TaxID=3089813 RepID=UPI0029D197A5|nr:lamin tail domain-containing protein [Actinocorallia sp. A-T 12471]MDX6741003.1 lamin tail domain-containing protein [Actinocorallia sp. A-T 12471]
MRSAVTAVVLTAAVLVGSGTAASAAPKPSLRFTKIQYDAPGPDKGGNSHINKEYVVIKNTGKKAVKFKNWTLRDAQHHVYKFPAFTLKAGKSVTVHTGKGDDSAKHLYMQRGWYIWNNTGDTATLRDAKGTKVLAKSWKKKPKPKPQPNNDPRFDTCADAIAAGYGPYYQGQDPEYYWYTDRDKDGVVCE